MADQSAERAVRCLKAMCGKDKRAGHVLRNVELSNYNGREVESVGRCCVKLFLSLHRKRDPSASSEKSTACFRFPGAD